MQPVAALGEGTGSQPYSSTCGLCIRSSNIWELIRNAESWLPFRPTDPEYAF